MTQHSSFFYRQVAILLQKPRYAWFMTGFLALFSWTSWLSIVVMALVTLRQGWLFGARCLIIGATASLCLAEVSGQFPEILTTTVAAYILCYVCAGVLKKTASWNVISMMSVVLATGLIVYVHWFAGSYLLEQYQMLLQIIKEIDQDNLLGKLVNNQDIESQLKFAHYLFGIKVLSVVVTAMMSLMLARSIQSTLYYPGGFSQEMLNFRASSFGVLLFMLVGYGAYQHDLLSISCLPIFFVYLMLAGISLTVSLLAKKKKPVIYTILFLPIVLLPYIVLPVYVLFGTMDSLFNLRARWRVNVDKP